MSCPWTQNRSRRHCYLRSDRWKPSEIPPSEPWPVLDPTFEVIAEELARGPLSWVVSDGASALPDELALATVPLAHLRLLESRAGGPQWAGLAGRAAPAEAAPAEQPAPHELGELPAGWEQLETPDGQT